MLPIHIKLIFTILNILFIGIITIFYILLVSNSSFLDHISTICYFCHSMEYSQLCASMEDIVHVCISTKETEADRLMSVASGPLPTTYSLMSNALPIGNRHHSGIGRAIELPYRALIDTLLLRVLPF